MPVGVDDALILGGSLLLNKLKGGGRRLNLGPIISRYMGQRPVGYTTPEDEAASERLRLRRAATSGKLASDARAGVIRRAAARGLEPSERSFSRIVQQQGEEGEAGAGAAEDFLYRTRAGRERFEQEKLMAAFGAEVGAEQENYRAGQLRQAAFWNSINDYLPFLFDSLPAGDGDLPSGHPDRLW